MLWKFSPSVKTSSPELFSKSPFLEAPGSLPLAVPSLVLHLTFIVPVGGVLVTFNVTEPSLSSKAYLVLILPLASEKKARGPCFLPPEILAKYFSRAFGSGAFCWMAFLPMAERVAFMRCTARDGLAFFVVFDNFAIMSCLSS